ncbi:MAG: pitrilysin family protein [Myxococcota bacterium]|nr:pitrilysin family protein [Myxococcota bacterium]
MTYIPFSKVPITHIQLVNHVGYGYEPVKKRGLSTLTNHLLKEGTKTQSALAISDTLKNLATDLSVSTRLEYSTINLNSLDENIDASLKLMADITQNPVFKKPDIARIKLKLKNSLVTEKDNLNTVATKAYRFALYGNSYLGRWYLGTQKQLKKITRKDIHRWYRSTWTPANSELIIVSGMTKDALENKLNKHFGNWKAKKSKRGPKLPKKLNAKPIAQKLIWIDKPDATQSVIMIGNRSAPFSPEAHAVRDAANMVLGGSFSSRLNLNLREDKGYTYGARSYIISKAHAGYYVGTASVKADTTARSVAEFIKEYKEIVSSRPVTAREHTDVVNRLRMKYPSSFETGGAILSQYSDVLTNRYPKDWLSSYDSRVSGITQERVQTELKSMLHPDNLVIVIVGDSTKYKDSVRSLGFNDVYDFEVTGRPHKKKKKKKKKRQGKKKRVSKKNKKS